MNTALLDEPAAGHLMDADIDTLLALWCNGGRSEWEEAVLRRELRARGLSGLVLRDLASRRAQAPRVAHDAVPKDRLSVAGYCRVLARRVGAMLWRAKTRRRLGTGTRLA